MKQQRQEFELKIFLTFARFLRFSSFHVGSDKEERKIYYFIRTYVNNYYSQDLSFVRHIVVIKLMVSKEYMYENYYTFSILNEI